MSQAWKTMSKPRSSVYKVTCLILMPPILGTSTSPVSRMRKVSQAEHVHYVLGQGRKAIVGVGSSLDRRYQTESHPLYVLSLLAGPEPSAY